MDAEKEFRVKREIPEPCRHRGKRLIRKKLKRENPVMNIPKAEALWINRHVGKQERRAHVFGIVGWARNLARRIPLLIESVRDPTRCKLAAFEPQCPQGLDQ